MFHFQPWTIWLIALTGNCGFWLFSFNRVNAAGFPRIATKRAEKLIVLLCFTIPLAIAVFEWQPLFAWLSQPRWWPRGAPGFSVWAAWSIASFVVLGSMWLESRRWLIPPRQFLHGEGNLIHIGRELPGGSTADKLTTWLDRLPGNQITDLEVTRKSLQLSRPISGIDGLKIGHLSDLHFTGQFRIEHYLRVVDSLMDLQPDLIVLTGDIVDFDRYVEWLEPVLGRLKAPLGCTFLLGNHDLRLKNVDALLTAMRSLGHFDVGAADQHLTFGDARVWLTGNEHPWFERHNRGGQEAGASAPIASDDSVLRLGLSHSPDQIGWARRQQLDLLLAGHTHGGQARFPCIGPILAPSWYGSKFASGVFYWPPTLMHVSRGVAGTHPLRWWCPPEVSLLTLHNPPGGRS